MWYWVILVGAVYPLTIIIIALVRAVYLLTNKGGKMKCT
ncbi:hypothetical protein ES708_07660 [subsurface metagenome]